MHGSTRIVATLLVTLMSGCAPRTRSPAELLEQRYLNSELSREARVLGTSGEWAAYQVGDICYVVGSPKSKPYQRFGINFSITHDQVGGTRSVCSYENESLLRQDSRVKVSVDGVPRAEMFVDASRGFTEDEATDAQLREAIHSGTRMVVQGVDARAREFKEDFRLEGVQAMIELIDRACPGADSDYPAIAREFVELRDLTLLTQAVLVSLQMEGSSVQPKGVEAIRKEAGERVRRVLDEDPKLVRAYAAVYARYFTKQEIVDLVARRRRPTVVQQDLAVADAVRTKASDDEFEKITARYFTPEELAERRSFMASPLGSKEKKLKDEILRDLEPYDAMVLDRLYPALANDLKPQLEQDGLIVRAQP